MSKERLESLKRNKEWTEATGEKFYTVDKRDYEWLIEQAGIGINTSRDKQALIKSNIALNERVQKLERELEEHKSKFTVEYTMSLRKRNKRYREAIDKIKGELYKMSEWGKEEINMLDIIRVLEGEE